jgi:hypothetical protein
MIGDMTEQRELVMRLPPGRRYVLSYDEFGASLYAVASVTFTANHVAEPAPEPEKPSPSRQHFRDKYAEVAQRRKPLPE